MRFFLTLLLTLNGLTAIGQLSLPKRGQAFQPVVVAGGGGGCTTNGITVNSLTQFGDTSNNTLYVTASYTPNSNSLVLATISSSATSPAAAPTSVTGNGLTWWQLGAGTNFDVLGTPLGMLSVWVSQGNASTVPTSGSLTATFAGAQTGCNIHVCEFLGADTNQLWGSNAIAKFVFSGSNAVANPRIDWVAPGNNGSNTMFLAVADDVNADSDNAPAAGWTEIGVETSYTTPPRSLQTYYTNMISAGTLFTTNAASSRDWAAVAVEIFADRAGCGQYLFMVDHDGAQTWMERDAQLTGAASGKQFTMSGWCQFDSTNGTQVIFDSAGDNVFLQKHSGGYLQASLTDSNGVTLVRLESNTNVIGFITTGRRYWFFCGANKAVEGTGYFIIDGTNCLSLITFLSDDVDLNTANFNFATNDFGTGGAAGGGNVFNGGLGQLWFGTNYLGASASNSFATVVAGVMQPVYLGETGTLPGATPRLYHRGPAHRWLESLGSGGVMVKKGTAPFGYYP